MTVVFFLRHKKMDFAEALSLTCKHLNNECRDSVKTKLKRQKHAAHAMTHRLRKKNAALELTNKLLTICWISVTRENKMIRENIAEYVRRLGDIDNNLSLQ